MQKGADTLHRHIHECAGVEMVEGGRVGANAAMARTGAATVVDLLN